MKALDILNKLKDSGIYIVGDTYLPYIAEAIEELETLKTTIEAQEIIIRDKTAIIEAMAQPKTCDGCKWLDSTQSNFFKVCTISDHQKELMCKRVCLDYYEPKESK